MSEQERSPDWKGYGHDQLTVEKWVRTTFGDPSMDSAYERACRLVEEAVELLQAVDAPGPTTRATTHKIVDMVFDKPVGDVRQEIGGVIVTLLAVCARFEVRLDDIAGEEIARITKSSADKFRAKQREQAALGVSLVE